MRFTPNVWAQIFGTPKVQRFTQDSPILPEVWAMYIDQPLGRHQLLLTPLRGERAGRLSKQLWDLSPQGRGKDRPSYSFNQSTVLATLKFPELIRIVLPMTQWWHQRADRPVRGSAEHSDQQLSQFLQIWELLQKPRNSKLRRQLVEAVEAPWEKSEELGLDAEIVWFLRMVGLVSLIETKGTRANLENEKLPSGSRMLDAAKKIVAPIVSADWSPALVFSVSRNRVAAVSSADSVRTVKGDAARRVFDLSCARLAWAVMDTGVDAMHPAFTYVDKRGKTRSRVKKAYDFIRLDRLIQLGSSPDDADAERLSDEFGVTQAEARDVRRALRTGRDIDWEILDPILRIDDHEQHPPVHPHGTHVAGILAASPENANEVTADLSEKDIVEALQGLCPDIELYDFRVLDPDGMGSEFSMIGALQLIRHLNAHKERPLIHGVNMSFWIPHDVRNYACGRTPICDECERLVASGVVAVASAGNLGFGETAAPISVEGGYQAISITDPGNAEGVITVGATHRKKPHTYGVSFFSSRGPTGDGRIKPDLVAPGEKILSPVPGRGIEKMDGTSQAAPHVSGAAALLLARHPELIGNSQRIKQILCETCTDLGRYQYFQGHGLVDALRAIESL